PDYFNYNRSVYLIDLRKTIPDSIAVCGKSVVPRINMSIPSGTEYKFYSDAMDIEFPLNAIYDTLYLNTDYLQDGNGSEIFTIGSRNVPLHKSIAVSLKPSKSYPRRKDVGVYRTAGRSYAFLNSEWINGRVHFNTREFGEFTILRDSIAPSILPLQVNDQTARFKIRDDLSGILSYEATIDGEWLLMYFDSKSNTIWSKQRDPKTPLKGDFQLRITDNAGNESYFTKKIF
ncbi:MAG TPA: hypothetical protein VK589_18425, partial [Chryseolinea sp.]|nr:hypothetical protein [Chryseolinea sp.]